MKAFTRLIFTIVSLSIVVALAVVLLANARSSARQQRDLGLEQQRFSDMLHRLDGHFRRADMVADWQKIDDDGHVIETSLLVREYRLLDAGSEPLPVRRVTIPGNVVHVDGMIVNFLPTLPQPFAAARNVHLAFFNHLFGAAEPSADDFTFSPRDTVPATVRIHKDYVTRDEQQFWDYMWGALPDDKKNAEPPKSAPPPGITFTLLPAASRTVKRGLLYTAAISADGVSIDETDDRRRVSEIINAAQAQAAQEATQPSP
ncbi:MAG TPA: hypothetical protein VH253_14315 [Phycisphaerae bacterium]|nr:hypothetical protein [Phycisphaerae bacterium]